MGTRGAFGVRIDGIDKLMYNHYDSYPEQLGNNLLSQFKTMLAEQGIKRIQKLARTLQVVKEETVPTKKQIQQLGKFADCSVATGKKTDWYVLLHKLQGDMQNILKVGVILDAANFMKDSLFCEWAYIWNLDDEVFEVYIGWQKKAHRKGRYIVDKPDESGYYGVALVEAIPFKEAKKISSLFEWLKAKGKPT